MCTLDYQQIDALEQDLLEVFRYDLTMILTRLNSKGLIYEFLDMIGQNHLLGGNNYSSVNHNGKILVLGGTDVSPNVLLGIAKKLNIDPNRFEFCLGYDEAKRFDNTRLKGSNKYAVIIVGPMPHKTVGTYGYSSAITAMERDGGYPPVLRAGNNELKLTKTSFRECLLNCIDNHYIAA